MSDIRNGIKTISGSEPTPAQIARVTSIAHDFDISKNDALFPLFVALDQYHGIFGELPEKMKKAAAAVAKEAAANTTHQVNLGLVNAISSMGPQIGEALTEHAQALTHVDRAKWIGGAVIASLLAVSLAFGGGYSAGVDSGKAEAVMGAAWMTTPAGQAALEAYQKNPKVAEWANSKAAKTAFALSKITDIAALAECSKPGWEKEKKPDNTVFCAPYAKSENEHYGWRIN